MAHSARRIVLGMALLLVASACTSQPEPPMERLSIEDGSNAEAWVPSEATVTTSKENAELGDTSLLFHIDVNHTTGQPDYPIGWPRMYLKPPEELCDWSGWDFLELVIHVETSRDALPSRPIGLILYTPDKQSRYDRTLSELKPWETVRIRIPLSEIPRHDNVPHIQFFISESDYTHGDTVDFTIDDIGLLRYSEPALSDIEALQSIAFSDATQIGCKFRLLGVRVDETGTVHGRLMQGTQALGTGEWELGRGSHEVWLKLASPPKVGEASLELYMGDPSEVAKVRIVPSPFAEEGGE